MYASVKHFLPGFNRLGQGWSKLPNYRLLSASIISIYALAMGAVSQSLTHTTVALECWRSIDYIDSSGSKRQQDKPLIDFNTPEKTSGSRPSLYHVFIQQN